MYLKLFLQFNYKILLSIICFLIIINLSIFALNQSLVKIVIHSTLSLAKITIHN